MGITLPNFTDLGFNDPRAAGGVPSYPQESAQAAGEAALGAGIQKAGSAAETIGAYGQMARTRMDRAMADANWYANAAQIDGDLKAESDINKLPDIQARYRQAAQQAAGAIGDPGARQMWLAEQEKHVVAGEKGAQLKALGLWRQNYEGNMLSQADAVVRTGAQQDDPRAFQFSLNRIQEMADSATQSGVMTPVQAHAFLKQRQSQLVVGGVGNLLNKGRVDDATALIDQNAADLDAVAPGTVEALRARVQAKSVGITGDAVAASALGLAASTGAGIPTGGAGTGEGHVAPQSERIAFTRQYAESKGINPDAVAATVAGEGLGRYVGDGGTSYGDFQLHVGGGMGDQAIAAGIDIRDPNTWRDQAKFAIDQMAANRDKGAAWYAGQWHGAPAWAAASFTRQTPPGGQTTTGADPLVGQPAPPPAPGQTPPPSPPPGMVDLANAESELARTHANRVLAIENDPRAAANPAVMAHALQKADLDFRAHQIAITAQKQAITEARSAAQDGYVKQMMQGPADPAIVQNIANDPKLDAASRENLWRVYEAHTKGTTDGDAAKYGPKFFDYYGRITAADDDPNKIRDPSQIMALAVPKPDGSQDLTLAGVDKLRQELTASRSPERVGDQKRIEGALAYAKHQLSFEQDFGYFKIPDPKGADAFNIGFIPSFFSYYEKGIAAGKRPDELLSQDAIDKLITPLKRTPEDLARDKLGAGTEAGVAAAKSTAPPVLNDAAINFLKAHPELQGAFEQKYKVPAAQFLTPLDTGPQAPLR